MKESKRRAQTNRIGNNHLGMAAIAVIALLLLGGLVLQSQSLSNRLAVYEAKAAALETAIENEKDRTEEIEELEKYMQTDEYAGQIAREKLGLVKDNEIVFQEVK